MVPYRSASKINQSDTTLEYFNPLQTHKYHTHSQTLPDVGRSVSRKVAEKHYDSRHDKLENSMNTIETTNTNLFKIIKKNVD